MARMTKAAKARAEEQAEADAIQIAINSENAAATHDIEFFMLDYIGKKIKDVCDRVRAEADDVLQLGLYGTLRHMSLRAIVEEQVNFNWARVIGLGGPVQAPLNDFEKRLRHLVESETDALMRCAYQINSTCPLSNAIEQSKGQAASEFVREAKFIIQYFDARREAQAKFFVRAGMPAGLKGLGYSDRELALAIMDFLKSRPDLQ